MKDTLLRFGPQVSGHATLSERLLILTEEEQREASIEGGFFLTHGYITHHSEAIVLGKEDDDTFDPVLLAPNVPGFEPLRRLDRSYDYSKAKLPPPIPPGGPGRWEAGRREFHSRHSMLAAVHDEFADAVLPDHLLGVVSALRSGRAYQFAGKTFQVPVVPGQRVGGVLSLPDGSEYEVRFVFRGCSSKYEYPFQPSFYRDPALADESDGQRAYLRLVRFARNLVKEHAHSIFGAVLLDAEALAVVQHYKIVPHTTMVDVTSDPRVALSFARFGDPTASPHLYPIVVLQPNLYLYGLHDLPARLLNAADGKPAFARPSVQRAYSLHALGPRMREPTGLVVHLGEMALDTPEGRSELGRLFGEHEAAIVASIPSEAELYPSESGDTKRFLRGCISAMMRYLQVHGGAIPVLKDVEKALADLGSRTGQ